ncbi:MAG: hypothetical protein ACI31D_09790 [Candidatus Limisoma sp.]
MKKIVIFQLLIAVLMLVSCSSTSSDFISAYEEATKELETATSNDDCDRIHDKLTRRLYEITQADSDWEKALDDEDVKNAYDAWNEALKNATIDNHWFVMVFCTPECAIDYCQRK